MGQPTNCEAVYDCYLDCILVVWDADPDGPSYYEIQRKEASFWTTIVEQLSPSSLQYLDCDVVFGGAYQYRIRSHYSYEFVDSEDDSWSDTEDDSWLMEVSVWCLTLEVFLPAYWHAPVTWTPTVLEPAYQVWLKNPDGSVVAVFDNWLSLDYTKKTRTYGYYQLVLSADDPRAELFEIDGQVEVWRRWPGGEWYLDFEGFHRRPRWWMDDLDIERFSSVGQGYEHLLNRRLIIPDWPAEVDIYADEMTDVLREMVRRHCVTPTDTDREVSGLTVEADDNAGIEILEELRHQKVLKALRALTEPGGDFQVEGTGPATFEFKAFWPYRGLDKTIGNGLRPPVMFSAEFANLRLPSYEQNWTDATTWVLVGGKGEGVMRSFIERENSETIDDTPWGRIESFVDARGEEEEEALELRGDIFLADHDRELAFAGEAIQIPACYYGRDWELGDMVSGQYRGHTLALLIEQINVRIPENGREEITAKFILMYEQVLSAGSEFASQWGLDYYGGDIEWEPYA